MIFTSFLLVFLDRGASEISTVFGLNQSFADILTRHHHFLHHRLRVFHHLPG